MNKIDFVLSKYADCDLVRFYIEMFSLTSELEYGCMATSLIDYEYAKAKSEHEDV